MQVHVVSGVDRMCSLVLQTSIISHELRTLALNRKQDVVLVVCLIGHLLW